MQSVKRKEQKEEEEEDEENTSDNNNDEEKEERGSNGEKSFALRIFEESDQEQSSSTDSVTYETRANGSVKNEKRMAHNNHAKRKSKKEKFWRENEEETIAVLSRQKIHMKDGNAKLDPLLLLKLIFEDVMERFKYVVCPSGSKERRDLFVFLLLVLVLLIFIAGISSLIMLNWARTITKKSHEHLKEYHGIEDHSHHHINNNKKKYSPMNSGSSSSGGVSDKEGDDEYDNAETAAVVMPPLKMAEPSSLSGTKTTEVKMIQGKQQQRHWENRIDFETTINITIIASSLSQPPTSDQQQLQPQPLQNHHHHHHEHYDIHYPPLKHFQQQQNPEKKRNGIPNFSSKWISDYSLCCTMNNRKKSTRKCANKNDHMFCVLRNNRILIRVDREFIVEIFGDETKKEQNFKLKFSCNLSWNNVRTIRQQHQQQHSLSLRPQNHNHEHNNDDDDDDDDNDNTEEGMHDGNTEENILFV